MRDLLTRILIEKWPTTIHIMPNEERPFLVLIEDGAAGRGKTMEAALVEAIEGMK